MYSISGKNEEIIELTLLWELAKALNTNTTPKELITSINNIFRFFYKIESVKIWVYDENIDNLKDLQDGWNNFCQLKDFDKNLLAHFKTLSSFNEYGFILNNKVIPFDNKENKLIDIVNSQILSDKICIILPITENNKVIGIIEIADTIKNKDLCTTNFWLSLNLVASQISSLISNMKLQEEMQLNIKFHAAMKDIAKIIESQYELDYIIPMIGEMTDKFMPEHLVYLFNKGKDGKYSLLWPSACNFERLNPLIEEVDKTRELVISNDKSIGVFPLFIEGHIIGTLIADGKSYKLNSREIYYLNEISRQVATTIDKASCYAEILEHATIDALTGLYNRRQFEYRFEQEVNIANRKNTPLCCMMLDIDLFKSINDTYGHLVGDRAIQGLSKVIREEIRTYDTAGRFGGEEFCIILPDTSVDQAKLIAERIRNKVEKTRFKLSSTFDAINKSLITVSIGISEYSFGQTDFKTLLDNADNALYKAKKSGRNQVVIFDFDNYTDLNK